MLPTIGRGLRVDRVHAGRLTDWKSVQLTGGLGVDVERLDAHVRRWRVARLADCVVSAASSSSSSRRRRPVHVETEAGMRREEFALNHSSVNISNSIHDNHVLAGVTVNSTALKDHTKC